LAVVLEHYSRRVIGWAIKAGNKALGNSGGDKKFNWRFQLILS
jgi:hypothetical protein